MAYEVFMVTEDMLHDGSVFTDMLAELDGAADEPDPDLLVGKWVWWNCQPGCLPDSDPFGPFETETEAEADARSDNDVPIEVTVDDYSPCNWTRDNGTSEQDEEGNWYTLYSFTVTCDGPDGERDQTIDGSTWEELEDGSCYACLTFGVEGRDSDEDHDDKVTAAFDAYVQRLRDDGYSVEME